MDRVRARRNIKTGLALAVMLGTASPVSAHPHVWITVESVVVYERGSITAIQHTWTFDEMYTTVAIHGLDANNDGNYDRNELAELAKVNMEGLKEFAYFTQSKLVDQVLVFEDPKDYYLEYSEARAEGQSEPAATGADKGAKPDVADRSRNGKKALSLHFTLPLKVPVLAEAPGFSFTVSDPTFFIAFALAKDNPVKLGAGAPPGCRVTIGGTERDAQAAKGLNEAFATQLGAQSFGLGFAKPIAVMCASKS